MNLNYIGSVAERFMRFRSSVSTEESVEENLFNAISIYIPKSLALTNLTADAIGDGTSVTADNYAVFTVTVDNYADVMQGKLLSDWLPVFNDGANLEVKLYLIVFDDESFAPTVDGTSITWSPLTKAFEDLYFISFFKTMFSEHYNGNKVESDPAEATDYDDSNYFDEVLCLASLCEAESTLSFCITEVQLEVPDAIANDTNVCKVMAYERGTETQHCTTLTGSTVADRATYFWGYVNLIAPNHTSITIHNGSFMLPIILGRWFEEKNGSGEFIGNKLAKVRLTGTKVKPTGRPSPLNTDVNLNLPRAIYEILDSKFVGYFMSISSSSDNNAQLVRDRNIANFPVTAYMISKNIDYTASQAMADYATAVTTLTDPVLANEKTYTYIQSLLLSAIQRFSGTGRITNIQTNFPPYNEAKKGNSFTGVAVWSATYVDDLESVSMSGTVNF